MARNVEIKARVESLGAVTERAAALADAGPTLIEQDDTFFRCSEPGARLKLRAFPAGDGELIFYRRADSEGPKESFYVRSPTAAPDSLREALTLAHGVIGRVRKRRTLFLAGRTRIHVDEVEGLGPHLELEVVLSEGESAEDGIAVAQALLARLGVAPSQCVAGAYLDLLKERREA
jgi:adenylate cyclase class IV